MLRHFTEREGGREEEEAELQIKLGVKLWREGDGGNATWGWGGEIGKAEMVLCSECWCLPGGERKANWSLGSRRRKAGKQGEGREVGPPLIRLLGTPKGKGIQGRG